MRILVVDDDSNVRRLVSAMLSRAGHRIEQASDGAAAVGALEAGRAIADLVITDVVMPGMDGFSLAETARKRWPKMRILFMSGQCGVDRLRKLLDRNSAFLPKPFDRPTLLQAVADLLGGAASCRVRVPPCPTNERASR